MFVCYVTILFPYFQYIFCNQFNCQKVLGVSAVKVRISTTKYDHSSSGLFHSHPPAASLRLRRTACPPPQPSSGCASGRPPAWPFSPHPDEDLIEAENRNKNNNNNTTANTTTKTNYNNTNHNNKNTKINHFQT